MPNRITQYFYAIAIAAALCMVGPLLDSISDAKASMAALVDSQHSAQQRERFELGAQAMCGENAGWKELPDGSVQCYTHRGYKTMRGNP